jgi:hypothetical protein
MTVCHDILSYSDRSGGISLTIYSHINNVTTFTMQIRHKLDNNNMNLKQIKLLVDELNNTRETSIVSQREINAFTNRYLSCEFSIYTLDNVANILRSVENDELNIDYKSIDMLDVFEHFCENEKDVCEFFSDIRRILSFKFTM